MRGTQLYKLLALHEDGRKIRQDALPEHWGYQDFGCEVSPSCLRCPLERCVYDGAGVHRSLLSDRDETLRRYHRAGASINALAAHYGLSRRTVFRVLSQLD